MQWPNCRTTTTQERRLIAGNDFREMACPLVPRAHSQGLAEARSVAQPGRALGLGPRRRRFKSCRSDHSFNPENIGENEFSAHCGNEGLSESGTDYAQNAAESESGELVSLKDVESARKALARRVLAGTRAESRMGRSRARTRRRTRTIWLRLGRAALSSEHPEPQRGQNTPK